MPPVSLVNHLLSTPFSIFKFGDSCKADQTAIFNGIKTSIERDSGPLHTAVKDFKNKFLKLSLWEKVKDFFRLSDTADNQRDAIVLFIATVFEQNRNEFYSDQYSKASMTLCRVLQDAGLTSGAENNFMEALTACAIAGLLARSSHTSEVVRLVDTQLTSDADGTVHLSGRVRFVSEDDVVPSFLENVALPFDISVESPFHPFQEQSDSVRVFTTLFLAMPREEQISLQLLYNPKGVISASLFSEIGFLGQAGQLNIQRSDDAATVNTVLPMAVICQSAEKCNSSSWLTDEMDRSGSKQSNTLITLRELKHAARSEEEKINAFTINLRHKHEVTGPAVVKNNLLLNLYQMAQSFPAIHINGQQISSALSQSLCRVATVAVESGYSNNMLLVEGVAIAWSRLIQKNLGFDEVTSQQVIAAVLYAGYQDGAGRDVAGNILQASGPSFRQTGKNHYTALFIDTEATKTYVMQAEFGSTTSLSGEKDLRQGGVSFELPESVEKNISDRVVGYTAKDILVRGFGYREILSFRLG